jgi:DMSO/TMAO reductase YedYZ molybdopterin-dependent catalytic subunit
MTRAALSLLVCVVSLASGPNQDSKVALKVTGDVGKPVSFTMDQLQKLKPAKAQLKEHDGTTSTYEGVSVSDVLSAASVSASEHPGKAVAIYVSAVASDEYQVVFGLGELTPDISGRNIVLAWKANGKPLGPNIGPLRIVVEGDKVQARCIRMVTELRVGQLRK